MKLLKICGNEHCTPVYGRQRQKHANMAGFDIEKTPKKMRRLEQNKQARLYKRNDAKSNKKWYSKNSFE